MAPKNCLLQLLLVHLVGLYGLQVYAETVNITLSTGNAESLCFPRSSIDRTWNVTGPRGSQVDLNCAHVTLLESDDCKESFLSILDTAGEVKICKQIRDLTQVSSENWMTIQFKRGACIRGRLNCFVRLKKTEEENGDLIKGEGAPSPSTVSGAMDTGDHADLIAQDNKKSNRCQRRNKKRIIGGEETRANEYTFMAYLEDTDHFELECGGTILTKRHVLTAAHCFRQVQPSKLQVVVGGHNRDKDCENEKAQTLYIRSLYRHENYSYTTKQNDIALLLLSKNIEFTEFVQPVHLPSVRYPLINQSVTAIGCPSSCPSYIDGEAQHSGNCLYGRPPEDVGKLRCPSQRTRKQAEVQSWGNLDCNEKTTETLHHVSLKVVELERCRLAYEPNGFTFEETTQICSWEPGNDTCQGDSGGPLAYVPPDSNTQVQVAIISCGECGLQKPGFNTDVFAYIDWIQARIDQYNVQPPLTFLRL